VYSKKNNSTLSVENLDQQLRSIVGDYQDTNLILAYSGGLDSTVLLHLLAKLKISNPFRFAAIHVNHQMNPNADTWTEFCKNQCRNLGIELHIEHVAVEDKGEGIEAAARTQRYRALSKYIQSDQDQLVTAHHRDDQAETLLLHLVRGAGVNGLAGMPHRRKFGSGWLTRPLLDFDRQSIQAYAESENLKWIEDESNSDPIIRRSFIRQSVLPILKQHWPGVVQSLAKSASHLQEADSLLRYLANEDLQRCSLQGTSDSKELSVSALTALSPDRLRNALRYWILSCEIAAPSTRQLGQLVKWIQTPPKTARAELSYGPNTIRIYRDRLWVVVDNFIDESIGDTVITWDIGRSRTIQVGNLELAIIESRGEGLSRARVGKKIEIRARQGGEMCQLPGRQHRTRVKTLLQQYGISPWERGITPFLYIDDRLAAIGDRWFCEPYAAREDEPSWKLRIVQTGENAQ